MNPKLMKEIERISYIFLSQPASSSTAVSSPPPQILGKYDEDRIGFYKLVDGKRFRPVDIVDGTLTTVDSRLLMTIATYRNQPRTI